MGEIGTGLSGSEKHFVFKGPCVPYKPLPMRCFQQYKISPAFLIISFCCNNWFCCQGLSDLVLDLSMGQDFHQAP